MRRGAVISGAVFMAALGAGGRAGASPEAMPTPAARASTSQAQAPSAGGGQSSMVVLTQSQLAKLPASEQADIRELAAIANEVKSADYLSALTQLSTLTTKTEFTNLPPVFTHAAYIMLAGLELRAGRLDDAYKAVRSLLASPLANLIDWRLALSVAAARRDAREEIVDLTAIATKYPDSISTAGAYPVMAIYGGVYALPDGPELRYRLGQALLAANWRPPGPFDDISPFLVDQVAAMLDHGDVAGARGLIGDVDEPVALLGARVDKRFATLVADNPHAFDLEALHVRRMAALDVAIAASPGLAAGVLAKIQGMLAFGDFAGALKLVDDTLPKIEPQDGQLSPYIDAQAMYARLIGERAQALQGLGRYDEALAELTRAANRPENGGINTTQRLELARLEIAMGQPASTTATLAVLEPSDLSVMGRLVVAGLRGCAAQAAGDTKGAEAARDYLAAHAADSPAQALQARVCMGDTDEAAQLLIGLLDHPISRLDALTDVQALKRPPAPPAHPNDEDRWAAVLARTDVQAAIAKVGSIETAPLYRSYF
jgi:tetratricopeptide (TPR) repeat protein